MATRRAPDPQKQSRKTEKLNVWLPPEQIEWLKRDKDGPSAAVRALIMEAVNLENLAKSVKGAKRKKPR